ncbi:Diacylglycerol kinase eta [Portunus trituberculatus]|uniref:Diacylglycerol kinase eta n=1 Tax=Portunus trituberculatus TaxID=210409 RepID=A0A5B7ELB1_PORTR|nr:Diacylglycerol kinase eta [Portunus trituberculatus]
MKSWCAWLSGTDESWEATRPQGCSPLLVFVNSKSGDNQGVRFLRRFKQLLNPAQVFDLMHGGPVLGLRLFKCFNPFRILICSGDGSVGWVLSEIDKLHMTVSFLFFMCNVEWLAKGCVMLRNACLFDGCLCL